MTLAQLLKEVRPYVRPYRWLVVLALILTLAGAFAAQVNAWVLRYAVDSVAALMEAGRGVAEGMPILVSISAILAVKEAVNILIQFGQKYYGEKLRIEVSRDLAQAAVRKMLSFELSFFTGAENRPGALQTRIDRGVESLSRMVQIFFINIFPLFANAAVALIVMFNANISVGFVAFCTVPIYYYVSRVQALRLAGSRRHIRSLRERKSQGILAIIESIPVIKSFLREDIEESKQMALQTDLTGSQMAIRRTNFFFDGLKSAIEQAGVAIIIVLTTYYVLDGRMTLGAIMFHILLYNNVSAPIRQLHMIYDQLNDALVYSEGFFKLLDDEADVEGSGAYRPGAVHGEFRIENLTFTYPGNDRPTLHNIDMTILPNRVTALVGLSGAGKTTLISLLDKFYRPDSGDILLDGVSLSEYDTAALRENIGLVLQKNHIFDGTVAENILYGNPDATHEEMVDASVRSFLHEQIMELPDGYRTPATSLSGGQQQKIAIARIFLKNPPVIFLDEPTASLDSVATEQIKNSLDAIKQGRTVIIISHSISQIIDADDIYVLEKGRMVEHGAHEDVYRQGGAYKDIFDAMARSLNITKIARTLE